MNDDQADLVRQFRELNDEELVRQCRSRCLTELAQAIAMAEMACRGLTLPAPAVPMQRNAVYEGDFVTVGRFLNPTDAHVVCACLQAGGVPAFVADANLVQMHSLIGVAVGGARILVPEARVAEAMEIIAAFNRGDFALPDDPESAA